MCNDACARGGRHADECNFFRAHDMQQQQEAAAAAAAAAVAHGNQERKRKTKFGMSLF
jgi:hypothetical protein